MSESEIIVKSWPLLLSALVFIAWLIRLEAKVLYMERDYITSRKANDKREEAMWKKFDEANEKLSQALQSLAKIEGKLEGHGGKDL